jgi:hypothetical protein
LVFINFGLERERMATKLEDSNPSAWVGFSDMNKLSYSISLTSYSLAGSLFTHPLTVLTVRQQAATIITGDKHVGLSIFNALKHSYSTLGVRGLFRGWLPIATMGAPSNVIYFGALEATRELFQEQFKSILPTAPEMAIDLLQTTCSSIVATFVSLIPYVPAEVLSSKLIVQGKDGLGMVAMAKSIYNEKRVGGFFKGFSSSFLVGVVGGAQWWFCYAEFRKYGSRTQIGKENPFLVEAGAGLLAGVSATIVSHPLDTIKTRIMTSCAQTSSLGFGRTLVHVIQRDGFKALLRGLPANVSQAALASTIFASSYELIKKTSST